MGVKVRMIIVVYFCLGRLGWSSSTEPHVVPKLVGREEVRK